MSQAPYFFQLQDPVTGYVLLYTGSGIFQLVAPQDFLMSNVTTPMFIAPGQSQTIMSASTLMLDGSATLGTPAFFDTIGWAQPTPGAGGSAAVCKTVLAAVPGSNNTAFTVNITNSSTGTVTYLRCPSTTGPQKLTTVATATDPQAAWQLFAFGPSFRLKSRVSGQYVAYTLPTASAAGVITLTPNVAAAGIFEVINNVVILSGSYNTAAQTVSYLSQNVIETMPVSGLMSNKTYSVMVAPRGVTYLTTNPQTAAAASAYPGQMLTDPINGTLPGTYVDSTALMVEPVLLSPTSSYFIYQYLTSTGYVWLYPGAYVPAWQTPPPPPPPTAPPTTLAPASASAPAVAKCVPSSTSSCPQCPAAAAAGISSTFGITTIILGVLFVGAVIAAIAIYMHKK